jgi:hypothetical protein
MTPAYLAPIYEETSTIPALMREWHDLADRVEAIADDDARHAVCARMDAILSECAEIERTIAMHDDGELLRHDVLSDVRA